MVRFLHGDFSVKGNHTEEGVLEKFKEENRERGIPEENVMNILETGSGSKLFFLNISTRRCVRVLSGNKQMHANFLPSYIIFCIIPYLKRNKEK